MENLKPIFSHFYQDEGLLKEPKQYFIQVANFIAEINQGDSPNLLDVGCANGSFIYYLNSRFPQYHYTGIDIFDEFLDDGRRFCPDATFINQSMLKPFDEVGEQYDIVTALAVMQLLNDSEVPLLFDYLFNRARSGARLYVFAPFNEYGMDVVLKYRHRLDGNASEWFPGGNAYSFETLDELVSDRCQNYRIIPFNLGMDLPPSGDPRRGWTIKTDKTDFQMTNGLKLLMDQYIVEIEV